MRRSKKLGEKQSITEKRQVSGGEKGHKGQWGENGGTTIYSRFTLCFKYDKNVKSN